MRPDKAPYYLAGGLGVTRFHAMQLADEREPQGKLRRTTEGLGAIESGAIEVFASPSKSCAPGGGGSDE
jgi:hypothetical protein